MPPSGPTANKQIKMSISNSEEYEAEFDLQNFVFGFEEELRNGPDAVG